MIDINRIVSDLQEGLPDAAPFAVVPMLTAQIPYVDISAGISLIDRIVANIQPSAWGFADATLDRWPEPVAHHALACIRALPSGKDRIEAMCMVANRLTLAERREALDGILDATLPESCSEHTKPSSRRPTITYLVRTLPAEWQEEWIMARAERGGELNLLSEALARRDVGRLTEAALRKMWSRIDHEPAPARTVPLDYLGIAEHLPPDLKALALARIRASDSQDDRLFHLVDFDSELTDAERREVVEVPWNVCTREDPRSQAEHLQRVAKHLPKVPLDVRRRWLQIVLTFSEDYDLQRGLMALLPWLSGAEQRAAADALVASVIREGRFYTTVTRWDLLLDEAFEPLLGRLREDANGSSRDEMIIHLIHERDAALADRCLLPLLDGLGGLGVDHRFEIVRALTPWLADRTGGAGPQALAALVVPSLSKRADPLYVIAREYHQLMKELELEGS